MSNRAVSNLKVPAQFKLDRKQRGANFLYFYSGRYRAPASSLVAHLVFQGLFPVTRNDGFEVRPSTAKALDGGLVASANQSVLRKTKEGYEFDLVLFNKSLDRASQMLHLEGVFTQGSGALDNYNPIELQEGFVPYDRFAMYVRLPDVVKSHLAQAFLGLTVADNEVRGRFFISKAEAEYLTCTPFVAIRASNLYVQLLDWVLTLLGTKGKPAQNSLPLSAVSTLVKQASEGKVVSKRNKVDSLVVLDDGTLRFIPDVDNTIMYEQALQDYGQAEDGSYSFSNALKQSSEFNVGVTTVKQLPANVPVLTDWVNFKFAYSQMNGMLATLDLERSVPVRPFHVREILNVGAFSEKARSYLNVTMLAQRIKSTLKLEPTPEELAWGSMSDSDTASVSTYLLRAVDKIVRQKLAPDEILYHDDVKLYHLHGESSLVSLRPVGRLLAEALATVTENLDNAYKSSSVTAVTTSVAYAKVVVKYAGQYDKVVAADDKQREAYLNQGLDPNHKVEALPLVQDGLGFMPHQSRNANMLRKRPKSIILSVDAGGGKTISVLTHILLLLKDASVKRPLIMCPGHLVKDYVGEAVYVTEGRLNVVPITTYSMRQNGMERMQALIERAPPNTVFVTDYDFVKRSGEQFFYGSTQVTVYRNVEFLRSMGFDAVFCDEAHYLKNVSSRSDAVAKLITDIPVKLLASGTIVHDTPVDLVAQVALLDPTIFGSREKFMDEYALETRGNKVLAWKPNALQEIHRKLRQHCVFVSAKRKEWAAILPPMDETFHAVDMSPAQMAVYQSLLAKTLEQIQEAAQRDPKLQQALADASDESKLEGLASLLKPYLARLETFLAAPARDELGATLLTTPEDRLSPKAKKINEICRKHLDDKVQGKILIFTNHVAAAEEIFASFPADLKRQAILYVATEKLEAAAEFEKNPAKMIMIGVEQSMNTGLNLQFASRLIRVETAWTPGELEQGNSRINRPNIKGDDKRDKIYLDWILVNRSFDITKGARLIGKMIQKAKFDNAEDGEYQQLPDVPLVPMTLDNIQSMNDFASGLSDYLLAYQSYQQVVHADFVAYREANPDKLVPTPIPSAGVLPGSKLMARTPYVPGMNIYGTDQLGLIRYDEFMRQDSEYELEGDDEPDDSDDDAANLSQREKNLKEFERASGLGVHTEFGEGTIVAVSRLKLKVELQDGSIVRPRKLATFVVTRASTSSKDIRKQLLKQSGDIPVATPIDVPPTGLWLGRKSRAQKEAEEEVPVNELSVSLYFSLVNDFLALGYTQSAEDNPAVVTALSEFGFRPTPEVYLAHIKTPQTLLALFKAWKAEGFKIPLPVSTVFKDMYTMMKQRGAKTVGWATKLAVRNYFLRQVKPSNDDTKLKPFPLIRDGLFYVALPIKGQMATRKAIRINVPNVRWKKDDAVEIVRFVSDKNEASALVKELLNASIKIDNLSDLKDEFKKLKVVRRKVVDDDGSEEQ